MRQYRISWWNLENLFDVENAPDREQWLQKALAKELEGWNRGILDQKLAQLASIIKKLHGGAGPDLLGVCEVENQKVLGELAGLLNLPNRAYAVAHHDTPDQRGIDVAFIFDQNIFTSHEQFSHTVQRRTGTRDLFQVNFRTTTGQTLVVVGNHWPSRTGSQYNSEPYRMMAAETMAYWHKRILEELGDQAAVLLAGDFNDEPFNRSVLEYLETERTYRKVENARRPVFLNLAWTTLGSGIGTYYYDNAPNVLDQFLASKAIVTGSSGFELPKLADGSFVGMTVERFPEMIAPGEYQVPKRFGRPKEKLDVTGFSDHFPISMLLNEK